MNKYDIIVLSIIGLHSLYRMNKPKWNDTHGTKFGRFLGTFVKDFLIALLVTALLYVIFYVSLAVFGFTLPFQFLHWFSSLPHS